MLMRYTSSLCKYCEHYLEKRMCRYCVRYARDKFVASREYDWRTAE